MVRRPESRQRPADSEDRRTPNRRLPPTPPSQPVPHRPVECLPLRGSIVLRLTGGGGQLEGHPGKTPTRIATRFARSSSNPSPAAGAARGPGRIPRLSKVSSGIELYRPELEGGGGLRPLTEDLASSSASWIAPRPGPAPSRSQPKLLPNRTLYGGPTECHRPCRRQRPLPARQPRNWYGPGCICQHPDGGP